MNEKARGLELIQEIERQEFLGVPKGKIIIVFGPGVQSGKTALLNSIMDGHHRKKAIDILGSEGHLISFDEMAAAGWLKDWNKKLDEHYGAMTKVEPEKSLDNIYGILSDSLIRGRRAGEELRKVMSSISANDNPFDLVSLTKKKQKQKIPQQPKIPIKYWWYKMDEVKLCNSFGHKSYCPASGKISKYCRSYSKEYTGDPIKIDISDKMMQTIKEAINKINIKKDPVQICKDEILESRAWYGSHNYASDGWGYIIEVTLPCS